MADVSSMRSMLPGAEMGSSVSTFLTGGACTTSRKLVRGASLMSLPVLASPTPSEEPAQRGSVPAGTSPAPSPVSAAPSDHDNEAPERGGLIPGLLDEVALLCLARLPSSDWRTARQVSSSWRRLFFGQERLEVLSPVRRRLGTLENWVLVKPSLAGPFNAGDASWRAMDLERGVVHVVPPLPKRGSCYNWTGAGAVAVGGQLACMGWKDDNIYAFSGSIFPASLSAFLWMYCPISNKWAEKKGVPSPCSNFACASDGQNRVYLAGGRRGGSIMEPGEQLSSAWVYHADEDRWAPIADMCRPCDYGWALFVAGKVWIIEGSGQQGKSVLDAQVYDPSTDSWELIAGMWPWLTAPVLSPLTVHQGRITVADVASQDILQYDPAANSWSVIAQLRGFSQPIEGRRRYASLESDGEHLYVMGGYLQAAYSSYGVTDIESWTPKGGWVGVEVGRKVGPIGSTVASAFMAL